MNFQIHLLPYILFVITLIGCHSKGEQSSEETATLTPSKTLVLPLDKQTPNWASDCQYYQSRDGQERLLYYSPVTNAIYQYDVSSSRLLSKTPFTDEGPTAIPEPMAVQMLSPDSILVATSYTKQVFLINGKGGILHKYTIVADTSQARKWRAEPSAKFYVSGASCVFETSPLANPKEATVYYKTPLGATLNLQTGRSQINYMRYPKEYQTGTYWTLFHNMQHIAVNRNGQMVVSYPVSSRIQVMGLDGNSPVEHEAQSRYFNGPTEPVKNGADGRIHFLRQNAYGAIYYDPYREVYYRFASQALRDELPKPAGPIIPATFMPTSVIILDKDFNKIGETLLPMKKHYYYNSFVGKGGLYISNSHPDNQTNKEDQVSFTCYKLVR